MADLHFRNYWNKIIETDPMFGTYVPGWSPITVPTVSLVDVIGNISDFVLDAVKITTQSYRPLVALSGGLDSTVALYMVAYAYTHFVDKHDNDCICVVIFNDSFVSSAEIETARLVVLQLQKRYPNLPLEIIESPLPIDMLQEAYGQFESKLQNKDTTANPSLLSTHAIEMYMDTLCERENFAVIDTTNKTEFWLSEINANLRGSIELFSTIPKSLLYAVGEQLAIPQVALDRSPLDSCLQHKKRTNYFKSLPDSITDCMMYFYIDRACYLLERKYSVEYIVGEFGYDVEFVNSVKSLMQKSETRLKNVHHSIVSCDMTANKLKVTEYRSNHIESASEKMYGG